MSGQPANSLEDSFITVHEKTTSQTSFSTSTSSSFHQGYTHTHSSKEQVLDGKSSAALEAEKDDPTVPRRMKLSARRTDLLPTLQTRLSQASFPDQIEAAGWSYGTETNLLKSLTREWLHNYDWEKELNQLNQDYDHWTCRINGLDIHYVRHDPWADKVKDPVSGVETGEEGPWAGKTMVNEDGQIVMPLLLIHGWPGTWYEFGKAIQLLKRRGRFQIIVPSLPGFGWSQGTKKNSILFSIFVSSCLQNNIATRDI
jgi:microsomal epoxide hydrolase